MRKMFVIDLETTGLSPESDEVIEIAILLLNLDWTYETILSSFVKPKYLISPFITKLTGISNDMVEGFPDFIDFKNIIGDVLKDSIIVGHNIKSFDLRFIRKLFNDDEWEGLDFIVLDTLHEARANIVATTHKLDYLCSIFDIKSDKTHRAEYDCIRNIELLKVISSIGKYKSDLLIKMISPTSNVYEDFEIYFDKPTSSMIVATNAMKSIEMLNQKNKCDIDKTLLRDFTICITGDCEIDRDELIFIINFFGGNVTKGITLRTNLLIFGEDYGSKVLKATNKGIPMLSHLYLYDFLSTGSTEKYIELSKEKLSTTKAYRNY